MMRMKIASLAKLIAKCWTSAEVALRHEIEHKHHDLDEECITALFRGELRLHFDRASNNGEVERAFNDDIRAAFPLISHQAVSQIGQGLIATVHFHAKEVERKTGADFGLFVVRPSVSYENGSNSVLAIDPSYGRGLLCQSKVFKRNYKWGKLKARQKANLQERLKYLALVLYKYDDQAGTRKQLEPFKWQLTSDSSLEEIDSWFSSGNFPALRHSEEILLGLAQGKFGTDDKQCIDDFVIPKVRPSLEIRILWPDGRSPGRTLDLRQYNLSGQQHVILKN